MGQIEEAQKILDLLKQAESLKDETARSSFIEYVLSLLPKNRLFEPREGVSIAQNPATPDTQWNLVDRTAPPGYHREEKVEKGRSITSFGPKVVDPTTIPPEKPPVYVLPAQEKRRVHKDHGTYSLTSAMGRILTILSNFPEGAFASEIDELIEDREIKGRATRSLSDAFHFGFCKRSRGRLIGTDASGRRTSMYRYFPLDSSDGVKKELK